jgi:hypothetical protein
VGEATLRAHDAFLHGTAIIAMSGRFERVIAAIDAVNAEDPNIVEVNGQQIPGELIYGRRMSETLARMDSSPSECLRIAARGQHIERWKVPRKTYPAERGGYLSWRKHQRDLQAKRLGVIMAAAEYGTGDIERVGALIRKERLKVDHEAQMLEDVICVMFFEYYLESFMAKVEEQKLADILAKTWQRMSEHGHRHALKLNLPPAVLRLLSQGIANLKPHQSRAK